MRAKITQSVLIAVFLFIIAYTVAAVTKDTLGSRFESEKREELMYYTNTLAQTAVSAEEFSQKARLLLANNTEYGLFLWDGQGIAAFAGNEAYSLLAAQVAAEQPATNQPYFYQGRYFLLQTEELGPGNIIATYDMSKHEGELHKLWRLILSCAVLVALCGGTVVFMIFRLEEKNTTGGERR